VKEKERNAFHAKNRTKVYSDSMVARNKRRVKEAEDKGEIPICACHESPMRRKSTKGWICPINLREWKRKRWRANYQPSESSLAKTRTRIKIAAKIGEIPLCGCHDEPMIRSSKQWRCAISESESRARFRASPKNAERIRRKCRKRREKTILDLDSKIEEMIEQYPFLKEVTSGS
jgi:hypothetical protein